MDYPNDFDIPAIPAAKTVAFSRAVGIWIAIVYFLIIVVCGFIFLGIRYKTNYPFLISIDPFTDEWSVVAYPYQSKKKIPQYQIMQEKLVHDFVKDWFTISADLQSNETRWQGCSREECSSAEQFSPSNTKCAISCKSSDDLYSAFANKVLPEYRARISDRNEKWNVNRILITQNQISENVGTWQVVAQIGSNLKYAFRVLGFVKIERNVDLYPTTFGYYVDDFNAFRIDDEQD